MSKGWKIGNETFRTTQDLVERIVTLDEGNGVLIDRIRELETKGPAIRQFWPSWAEEKNAQIATLTARLAAVDAALRECLEWIEQGRVVKLRVHAALSAQKTDE
jgi:hypothetical protein